MKTGLVGRTMMVGAFAICVNGMAKAPYGGGQLVAQT